MVYLVLEPSNGQVQAEIEKDSAETKDTVAKIMAQMADMSKDPTKSRRALRGAPRSTAEALCNLQGGAMIRTTWSDFLVTFVKRGLVT